ncbi:hypothetical protein KSP40_PGU007839 [Platanthera guangdongensis]|uniref:Uncharacterized protein n=1 Tax=Platanthera guangdongensis TaxID=2320717 RepID=A0ABR2MX43_9ASPA
MDAKEATSAESTENPVKNAELRTADLNQVKMSNLISCRKKDEINRDLERAVEVKDLSRSDLDEKMIELMLVRNMEELMCQKKKKIELLNAENEAFASKISDLEEKGKKREELLKEKGDLVLKLVRELEVKSRKEKELELLIAENKTLASKIPKKEIGDRLRDEVLDEPRKENSTLVAGSEEIEEDLESALIDELVELKVQRSQLLANHDISCGMGSFTQLKIDELKSKMTRKNIVDEKRAEYEVRMSNLVGELAEHKSSERIIGDAYRSCIEKYGNKAAEIVSKQRELKMKAVKAVDLRMQFRELLKGKKQYELMCSHLQLDLNGLTRESVKMRTHIDYLTAEKASLVKHLETSQKELKDVQRTLMVSVSASCSVLSKLKKTAAEAVGHEGAQDNCIRGHPPGEILVIHGGMGGDSERPSSLARLRRLVASSSMEGVGNPYNDAVVIKATIENILVHRVLLDSGSSVNVLYKRAFERMGLDPRTLIPPECPQFDSFGDRWEADGIVILPVTLGDDRGKYTKMTRFHVFNGPDHYNAIFGRPLLNDFQAIVYTYNLTMQFPADGRQVIIRGDVISARECYLRAVGGLEDSAQSKEGESRN